jgi:hypothetical protein
VVGGAYKEDIEGRVCEDKEQFVKFGGEYTK